jgi:hypothetical protein
MKRRVRMPYLLLVNEELIGALKIRWNLLNDTLSKLVDGVRAISRYLPLRPSDLLYV